jgi:frataxin
MSPVESSFESLAERTLTRIFDGLEESDAEDFDSELKDGVLNIELDDGRVFIINRHVPLKQIWLSSPYSGAGHFAYSEENDDWLSTRDEGKLFEILSAELSEATGATVNIS